MRPILVASLTGLRLVRAALLSAGLAALGATAASFAASQLGNTDASWTGPIQTFAIQVALACLTAALGSSALMPQFAELAQTTDESTRPAPWLSLLLAIVAALALLQIPSIASWWAVDRALLAEAFGADADPLGLQMIPTVILLSMPALAAIAVFTFVTTSAIGALVPRDLAFRVLLGCVVLQAGVVFCEYLILHALQGLGSTVQTLVDRSSDAKASAQAADFLSRHEAPSAGVSGRLLWLLAGYGLAAAGAFPMRRRRTWTPT